MSESKTSISLSSVAADTPVLFRSNTDEMTYLAMFVGLHASGNHLRVNVVDPDYPNGFGEQRILPDQVVRIL